MTTRPPDDEFYVGYEPVLPPVIARRLRRVGALAAVLVVVMVGLGLSAHARLSPSRFDFGRPREVDGVLDRRPYPALTTADGRRSWLVGHGKHDAESALARAGNGPVHLRGTAIARGTHTMFEVVAGSVSARTGPTGGSPLASASAAPGREVTLAGEIVDSKCHLGVMNPGEGTVHRDCASLCLRGGIPPMLLVRDGSGGDALVLLVGRDGRGMSQALSPLAGVPVEVRGRLVRDDRGLVLAADLDGYRRITR